MAKDINLCSGTQMTLLLLLCFFTTLNIIPQTEAVWLTIPTSGTKCMSEEIQTHVVVLADYYVVADDVQGHPLRTVSVKVTSPYGNSLHHNENVTHGQFAFTTTESGNYVACFWIDSKHQEGAGDVTLSLEWKTGIAAKDWDTVAKKEKIEGVELELRKLEGAVEAIRDNLIYLKDREAEMREVSEKTNARVAWFSIMAIGVCILVSVMQLWFPVLAVGPSNNVVQTRVAALARPSPLLLLTGQRAFQFKPLSFSSAPSRKLLLYSKPGCCLCDGLKEKLQAAFLLSGPDSLHDIRDITSNPEWESAYQYEIPVLAKVLSDGTEYFLVVPVFPFESEFSIPLILVFAHHLPPNYWLVKCYPGISSEFWFVVLCQGIMVPSFVQGILNCGYMK
ncbi:Thioredoxin-like superfamily [Sesbania bispinosa]|nr:Thioredoxin-like superfamily [Sesbania bispinosa]